MHRYRYAYVQCKPCKRTFEVGRNVARAITVKDKCPRCDTEYTVKLNRSGLVK